MNESKLERRVDAKRPDVELEWNEPARFNALGIAETWSVTVEAEGKRVLIIGDQYVAGLDTDELEPFSATIRSCAMHLLGFIGARPVAAHAEPASRAPAAATVLTDERIDALARPFAGMGGVEDYRTFARAIESEVLAHAGVTAEPAGDYVQMPKRLTAENGAKGALSGEFKESITVTCHECGGSGDDAESDNDAECPECKGDGTLDQAVPVTWDTIKDIYKAAVALLAAPTIPAQVPAAEVRAQALREAADLCMRVTPDRAKVRSIGEAAHYAACRDAIRDLAHQSTADKASEVRAAEWISVEDRLPECNKKPGSLGVEVIVYPQPEKGESTAFFGCRLTDEPDFYKYGSHVGGVTHWMPIPAAPSTAHSANTGALGEKGADHA